MPPAAAVVDGVSARNSQDIPIEATATTYPTRLSCPAGMRRSA
jgi:hypothetical protein